MANLNGFDAGQVEPNVPYEPLPEGWYQMVVAESSMEATKKGDGSYLELKLVVVDGKYEGRPAWDRLCINHPNELTQKIARGTLSSVCRAVGVMQPKDSIELHNLPMLVHIKVTRRKDNNELTNEVKGYKPKSASGDTCLAATVPQKAIAEADQKPWARN